MNWVSEAGGLPPFVKRIAKHLQAKGKSESEAIAVAVNAVKKMCATGDVNLPGEQNVNAKSRAEACKAVARWEAMKAKAGSAKESEFAERAADESTKALLLEWANDIDLRAGRTISTLKNRVSANRRAAALREAALLVESDGDIEDADRGFIIGRLRDEQGFARLLREAIEQDPDSENCMSCALAINEAESLPWNEQRDDGKHDDAVLRKGHNSARRCATVEKIQKAIEGRGIPVGNIDGVYGPKTERGARKVQRLYGLKPDGVVGRFTRQILNGDTKLEEAEIAPAGAFAAGQPAPKAKGRSTAKGKIKTRSGGSRNAEFEKQHPRTAAGRTGGGTFTEKNENGEPVDDKTKDRLNQLGYKGADAVRRYQRAHGLKQDGIAGPATRGTLNESFEKPAKDEKASKGGSKATGSKGSSTGGSGSANGKSDAGAALDPAAILKLGIGMEGKPDKRVQALQTLLERLGFSVGKSGSDGKFGPKTQKALQRFQKEAGITANGKFDDAARQALARALRREAILKAAGDGSGDDAIIEAADPAIVLLRPEVPPRLRAGVPGHRCASCSWFLGRSCGAYDRYPVTASELCDRFLPNRVLDTGGGETTADGDPIGFPSYNTVSTNSALDTTGLLEAAIAEKIAAHQRGDKDAYLAAKARERQLRESFAHMTAAERSAKARRQRRDRRQRFADEGKGVKAVGRAGRKLGGKPGDAERRAKIRPEPFMTRLLAKGETPKPSNVKQFKPAAARAAKERGGIKSIDPAKDGVQKIHFKDGSSDHFVVKTGQAAPGGKRPPRRKLADRELPDRENRTDGLLGFDAGEKRERLAVLHGKDFLTASESRLEKSLASGLAKTLGKTTADVRAQARQDAIDGGLVEPPPPDADARRTERQGRQRKAEAEGRDRAASPQGRARAEAARERARKENASRRRSEALADRGMHPSDDPAHPDHVSAKARAARAAGDHEAAYEIEDDLKRRRRAGLPDREQRVESEGEKKRRSNAKRAAAIGEKGRERDANSRRRDAGMRTGDRKLPDRESRMDIRIDEADKDVAVDALNGLIEDMRARDDAKLDTEAIGWHEEVRDAVRSGKALDYMDRGILVDALDAAGNPRSKALLDKLAPIGKTPARAPRVPRGEGPGPGLGHVPKNWQRLSIKDARKMSDAEAAEFVASVQRSQRNHHDWSSSGVKTLKMQDRNLATLKKAGHDVEGHSAAAFDAMKTEGAAKVKARDAEARRHRKELAAKHGVTPAQIKKHEPNPSGGDVGGWVKLSERDREERNARARELGAERAAAAKKGTLPDRNQQIDKLPERAQNLSATGKAKALVDGGLADDMADAAGQLVDMGEISQRQADKLIPKELPDRENRPLPDYPGAKEHRALLKATGSKKKKHAVDEAVAYSAATGKPFTESDAVVRLDGFPGESAYDAVTAAIEKGIADGKIKEVRSKRGVKQFMPVGVKRKPSLAAQRRRTEKRSTADEGVDLTNNPREANRLRRNAKTADGRLKRVTETLRGVEADYRNGEADPRWTPDLEDVRADVAKATAARDKAYAELNAALNATPRAELERRAAKKGVTLPEGVGLRDRKNQMKLTASAVSVLADMLKVGIDTFREDGMESDADSLTKLRQAVRSGRLTNAEQAEVRDAIGGIAAHTQGPAVSNALLSELGKNQMSSGDAVNSVWQSLSDDELKSLTPPKFYEIVRPLGISDEDAEDAWAEFEERQQRLRGLPGRENRMDAGDAKKLPDVARAHGGLRSVGAPKDGVRDVSFNDGTSARFSTKGERIGPVRVAGPSVEEMEGPTAGEQLAAHDAEIEAARTRNDKPTPEDMGQESTRRQVDAEGRRAAEKEGVFGDYRVGEDDENPGTFWVTGGTEDGVMENFPTREQAENSARRRAAFDKRLAIGGEDKPKPNGPDRGKKNDEAISGVDGVSARTLTALGVGQTLRVGKDTRITRLKNEDGKARFKYYGPNGEKVGSPREVVDFHNNEAGVSTADTDGSFVGSVRTGTSGMTKDLPPGTLTTRVRRGTGTSSPPEYDHTFIPDDGGKPITVGSLSNRKSQRPRMIAVLKERIEREGSSSTTGGNVPNAQERVAEAERDLANAEASLQRAKDQPAPWPGGPSGRRARLNGNRDAVRQAKARLESAQRLAGESTTTPDALILDDEDKKNLRDVHGKEGQEAIDRIEARTGDFPRERLPLGRAIRSLNAGDEKQFGTVKVSRDGDGFTATTADGKSKRLKGSRAIAQFVLDNQGGGDDTTPDTGTDTTPDATPETTGDVQALRAEAEKAGREYTRLAQIREISYSDSRLTEAHAKMSEARKALAAAHQSQIGLSDDEWKKALSVANGGLAGGQVVPKRDRKLFDKLVAKGLIEKTKHEDRPGGRVMQAYLPTPAGIEALGLDKPPIGAGQTTRSWSPGDKVRLSTQRRGEFDEGTIIGYTSETTSFGDVLVRRGDGSISVERTSHVTGPDGREFGTSQVPDEELNRTMENEGYIGGVGVAAARQLHSRGKIEDPLVNDWLDAQEENRVAYAAGETENTPARADRYARLATARQAIIDDAFAGNRPWPREYGEPVRYETERVNGRRVNVSSQSGKPSFAWTSFSEGGWGADADVDAAALADEYVSVFDEALRANSHMGLTDGTQSLTGQPTVEPLPESSRDSGFNVVIPADANDRYAHSWKVEVRMNDDEMWESRATPSISMPSTMSDNAQDVKAIRDALAMAAAELRRRRADPGSEEGNV